MQFDVSYGGSLSPLSLSEGVKQRNKRKQCYWIQRQWVSCRWQRW